MKFFTDLSIRNKVFLAFAAILLLATALAGFALLQVFRVAEDSAQLTANVRQLEPLGEMAKDMQQLSALAESRHILSTVGAGAQQFVPPNALVQIRQQETQTNNDFHVAWDAYAPTMDSGRETADGNAIHASFDQLVASARKIIFADDAFDSQGALQILTGDFQQESAAFTRAMNDDVAYQDVQTRQLAAAAKAARARSILGISFILAFMLAGTVLIGFGMVQGIARPVAAMTTAMRKLAHQEMDLAIPGIGRKDELGEMAAAVQVFRENGLQRLQLEAEAAEFQQTLDRKLKDMEAAFEAAGHDQQHVVAGLGTALSAVAAGDLSTRLDLEVAAAYARLKQDFNAALGKLEATMQAIARNTQAVSAGAGEITTAADDLSRRTEQQAASLEQTAAALDQITTTVKKAADGADAARRMANGAKSDAEQSGVIVNQTVEAMSAIEGSSRKISNIIGVIDEIAFQTNLLALNAGIEAARAGDAGKGFAVVATEVRALAQRSAEAAKEIKTLISASGQQVESGVKLVGATGSALSRIVEQVTRLTGQIGEIAASAQEQATGLAEVNIAVNRMDQVTQQNAAMVEQTTAASHSLSSEAVDLARLVGQFQIGQRAEKPAEIVKLRGNAQAKLVLASD